ncbi:Amidase domain-containing protein [Fusarium sp. LHS14.1]|nr:Amidase domain-containing protein [Fusarium sp. LHS14.1]
MYAMEIKVDALTLTAAQLQRLLEAKVVTSVDVVKLYLAQISKHNHAGLHLNAIISVAEYDSLIARAQELDHERSQGRVRGPFHGIPIILKDLCNTVDLPTTCGSYAFKQGRPKKDANLINTLKEAGLIILAKANLSELGNAKGSGLMAGWSAVGGQTQSPYIKGGVAKNATWFTHTGPAGSSSGSAVSVAAGFAPVSLGTELNGSIMMPAARAGVYAVKLTPESVDNDGFQPGAPGWDSQGPYARTVTDTATLSAILQLRDPGYYHPLTTSWNGLKVGFVDPSLWRSFPKAIEQVKGFINQTDNAPFAAQEKTEESGGKVARSVPVASWEDITGAMPDFEEMEEIFPFQMKRRFPKFLQLFESVPQTLEELIKFNEDHADLEFTERDNNQKGLEAGRDTTITQEEYDRDFKALRGAAAHSLLSLMKEYDVDVLLGPCDSRFNSMGAAAGFPVGNLPLGFADFNGRPFSLHAIAPANEEAKIFQVMSAWEASFPDNVRPPPLLIDGAFPVQQIVMEDAN